MRTDEWTRTRQSRAENCLAQAQNQHELSLVTLLNALREITDDPPTEDSARILALALGCLNVGAFVYLVGEARRALERYSRSEADTVKERVKALSQSHDPQSSECNWEDVTVDKVRESTPIHGSIIHLAVVFQALVWAMAAPPNDPRLVVY